ncbi:MAG: hypothetical protein PHQ86_08020 [Dehalococcoidales bacterium]|nr:hypothetical protein [Dehalococcoidales bacterium]
MQSEAINELKLQLTLRDAQAIEIVNKIPEDKRDDVIGKYIILGNMVTSYASISASKETVEDFFAPLKSDIQMIREQLKFILPTVATPASKGSITVESIFKSFEEHFYDDSFEDVSMIGKYADIKAVPNGMKSEVLIELKDYSAKVPTTEVDKFWRDMERRNVNYGIFISMRTGITKISCPIKVETHMGRTGIFVNNNELNFCGHLFAYYALKRIMELENIKNVEMKGDEVIKLIPKINKHLKEMQGDIKTIEKIQEIADGLKTTSTNRLQELINLSNGYKKNINTKINELMEELSKVEA